MNLTRKEVITMAEIKKETNEKQEVCKPQSKCGCGCTPPVKK